MFKQMLTASIVLLGFASVAVAQTCTLPKIADSVALKQLPGSDLMLVPVTINGTLKQFLLDIGMNPTEVSQPTVTELGLPENRKLTEAVVLECGWCDPYHGFQTSIYDVKSGLGRGSLDTRVRVDSFTVGAATARHMQLLVTKDLDMGRIEPYDGLMTGDFFKQYDVELDFAGKKILFLTPTNCTNPDQVAYWPHTAVGIIPVTFADDGKLQVQVMIQGHIINAEIDTSSARSFLQRGVADQMLGFKVDKDMVPQGDLKDGMGMQVYGHIFPQIFFHGGVEASNVPVLIEANSMVHMDREAVLGSHVQITDTKVPDFTIGLDVLHRLHMYVVYGQGRIYVTSAG